MTIARLVVIGYALVCLRSIVVALLLLFDGPPLPILIPQGDTQTLAPPRGYNRPWPTTESAPSSPSCSAPSCRASTFR